jgi:LPXTG-site transpeptidase (sortase) family protein
MRLLNNRVRTEASRLAPFVLTMVGLLICCYVAGNYAWMITRQHRLAREWQTGNTPAGTTLSGNRALAKLMIPKIGLDAVVVEGTTREALLLGPGHLKNSSFPGGAGNLVIAAHRDTFFRRLNQLVRGDSIYVDGGDGLYPYTVTETKIVEPLDTSAVSPSNDVRLTLITCYPIHYLGPAPKRLVVIALLNGSLKRSGRDGGRAKEVVGRKSAQEAQAKASPQGQ